MTHESLTVERVSRKHSAVEFEKEKRIDDVTHCFEICSAMVVWITGQSVVST